MCDDGNLLSHDGCSSTCKVETRGVVAEMTPTGLSTWDGTAVGAVDLTPTQPTGRYLASAAYDPDTARMGMVGGAATLIPTTANPSGSHADWWSLGLDGWHGYTTSARAARPGIAYDPHRPRCRQGPAHRHRRDPCGEELGRRRGRKLDLRRLGLGADPGKVWEPFDLGASSPMAGHVLVYHALMQRLVAFGHSGETWVGGFGVVREACTTGFDGDHDGLVGCADPDCWGWCTPECPPGASCPADADRCGDGVCNPALETPRLCAQDCGKPVPVCGDRICDPGETSCPGDCGTR